MEQDFNKIKEDIKQLYPQTSEFELINATNNIIEFFKIIAQANKE